MANQSSTLIIRSIGQSLKAKIFLDNIEIGDVPAVGEVKSFGIKSGYHYIYAKTVSVGGALPVFTTLSFNIPQDENAEIDVAITVPFNQGIFNSECKLRDTNLLVDDDQLPFDLLKGKLNLFEIEKESLENIISKSPLSVGMSFVWLAIIILLSIGCSVVTVSPAGAVVLVFGLLVLGLAFYNTSHRKSAVESRLQTVKTVIAQTKHLVDGNKSSKKEKITENSSESSDSSSTQNLEKELRRIKKLLDDELITNEEYQELRKKVMKSG